MQVLVEPLSDAAANNSFPTAYLRGDVELDRDVDITDFRTLVDNIYMGSASPKPGFDLANFDGDGDVDITDFSSHFLPNFIAAGGGSYGASSVPEPSTWMLCVTALLGWIVLCRRRQTV